MVTDARKHDLYFDNYFTSLLLLKELKNISLPATNTIRSNRAPGLLSPSNTGMAKKDSRFMSICSTNDVCLVLWLDKMLVTVGSNHLIHGLVKTVSATLELKRHKLM